MKLTDLVEKGNPERLTTGYFFTEGPVWMPDGFLLFSDIQGNTIHKWTPDGEVERFRYPSHNANGNTVGLDGRLITCEHETRRVSRTEPDGTVTTLADKYDGKRLNSPNDVIVKSDGSVYFTDSVAHTVPKEEIEQECNGLYRVKPDGSVERLADDIQYPNGLAFNPDESILYVVDSALEQLRTFDVNADGSLSNSRVFIDMEHPQSGFYSSSPDGMKVDTEGNIYVTGADGIWVFQPDGTWIGNLVTRSDQRHSEPAVNLAWGGDDRKTLFVTACSSVYRFQVKIPGTG
jgi:gluconolactonase